MLAGALRFVPETAALRARALLLRLGRSLLLPGLRSGFRLLGRRRRCLLRFCGSLGVLGQR
jgi:hypothetical protein